MPEKFYAVAHGFKRGVYTDYSEVQKQIDGFPQPVYKKFETKEEADKYYEDRKEKQVSFVSVEADGEKFYAVARGYVVGIFTDYEEVKKSIKDYPQPLHKKFSSYEEADQYYKKFHDGVGGQEEKKKEEEDEIEEKIVKKDEKPLTKDGKATTYYAVARGHKTGVFTNWNECKEQTTNFKGAKFKKFDNKEDAEMFAAGKTVKQIEEAAKKRKSDDGDGGAPAKKAK